MFVAYILSSLAASVFAREFTVLHREVDEWISGSLADVRGQ